MYKKILLCIDGSEDAHKAVNKVMEFYNVWNSQIVVFHSIEHHRVMPTFSLFSGNPYAINSYKLIRDDYEKLGRHILEETKKIFDEADVPIETRLIDNIKPDEYAIEIAKEENFDLIVLGSRGHHSKLSMILGTVATHVVNNAECDVLIIR
jgi:nucleotide-binding universal stress UspA family protein